MITKVFVPGKLFVAGEYAVVDAGNDAIIIAVDKGIEITATNNNGAGVIVSEHFQNPVSWSFDVNGALITDLDQKNHLLLNTLNFCAKYAASEGLYLEPLKLEIASSLEDPSGKKYGLGSSGAVTVALIKLLSNHFQWELDELAIFKLALISTWSVQPKASGGDIAASAFGGWIFYRSTDHSSISRILQDQGIAATVQSDWNDLMIERLPAPKSIIISVGWTGNPVKTEDNVANYDLDPGDKASFISASNAAVARLREAIIQDDATEIFAATYDSKQNLLKRFSRPEFEYQTAEFVALDQIAHEHGALSKISGAGGGDCAIVFSVKSVPVSRMHREWNQTGIVNLLLNVFEYEEYDD